MKRCCKCQVTKPLDDFRRDKSRPDGRRARCKTCINAIGEVALEYRRAKCKAWRVANPERVKANNRAWLVANPKRKRAHNDAWRAAHPEQFRASKKAYRDAHPESNRANARAWRAANPERAQANSKAWKVANPERGREASRCYRGRQAGALQDGVIVDYVGKACTYCQAPAECVDHFYPLGQSLDDRSTNKVPACNACNNAKGGKDPYTWLADSNIRISEMKGRGSNGR